MPDYHLDCWSGLSGDMFLGACLDLGMPLAVVEEAVAALALPGVAVECRRAARGGLVGTRFRVLLRGRPIEGPDPEARGLGDLPDRGVVESLAGEKFEGGVADLLVPAGDEVLVLRVMHKDQTRQFYREEEP